MNVHFLLLSCSALRADKGWLLTDLHVTSCLHSAAIAPASANVSTTKSCFPSGFLQPLSFAKHLENPLQSPWAGRGFGLVWSFQIWSQLVLKAGAYPGPHQAKPGVSPPLDTCTAIPPSLPHVAFGPSPSPPHLLHPHHYGLWAGGKQDGASEPHVCGANVPTGLTAAHTQDGKGKGEMWPFSLSALTRPSFSIWMVFYKRARASLEHMPELPTQTTPSQKPVSVGGGTAGLRVKAGNLPEQKQPSAIGVVPGLGEERSLFTSQC